MIVVVWLAAAIRLGSRTLLVISAVSWLLSYFVNGAKFGAHLRLLILTITGILVAYIYLNIDSSNPILHHYADRLDSDEYGILEAGGRSERWSLSLSMIQKNPFGWELEAIGFSHNMWLDVARGGGWLSLAILLFFTVVVFRNIFNAFKSTDSSLSKTIILCSGFGYLLLFMVEPIFDGFLGVFAAFCCYLGLIQRFKKVY